MHTRPRQQTTAETRAGWHCRGCRWRSPPGHRRPPSLNRASRATPPSPAPGGLGCRRRLRRGPRRCAPPGRRRPDGRGSGSGHRATRHRGTTVPGASRRQQPHDRNARAGTDSGRDRNAVLAFVRPPRVIIVVGCRRSTRRVTHARERSATARRCARTFDVFERMLTASSFEFDADDRPGDRAEPGQRQFTNPVRQRQGPEAIADPDYQTELAQYNIELNVQPRPLPGDSRVGAGA